MKRDLGIGRLFGITISDVIIVQAAETQAQAAGIAGYISTECDVIAAQAAKTQGQAAGVAGDIQLPLVTGGLGG